MMWTSKEEQGDSNKFVVWRLPDQRLTAMGGVPVVQGNATLPKEMGEGEKGVDCE